jgi:hypothetical protein
MSEAADLIKAIAALVAALAWPALVLYIVFSMGRGARNRG